MSTWHFFPASTFPEHAEQWDRLNRQLYRSHPMLDSRFVSALLKHFGHHQVLLAVYPGDDTAEGNMALLQRRKAGMWETFLPSQTQIAPLLCGNPRALHDLFDLLPGFTISIDILSQDPFYTFSLKDIPFATMLDHVVTMNITLLDTFETYWRGRSKKLQQNLKRYSNRLSKDGIAYKLKIFSTSEELNDALYRYGELETMSWKGAEGTAINSRNEQGRFYLDVLNSFASSQQAEIVELYLNDQLAASRINILSNDILITLKTTYDETLSIYAPGRLLLYLLIEREFALKRVQAIEFYTNATIDQLSWCTGKRAIKHLTLYQTTNIQRLFRCFHHIKSKFKDK